MEPVDDVRGRAPRDRHDVIRRDGKRLTLVRHAKSDWTDASMTDFDRPLNPRGERDAPEMAARLVASGLVPTLMISSPAARARATAAVFATAFGYPPERIRFADDAYLASCGELLNVLHRLGKRARHVMLFGHNPGLSDLAIRLVGDDSLGDMPTCAVTSLLVPLEDWNRLQDGSARLDFHDFPKNTR